jgi:GNAT superfamily N-acetyltransferase
VSIGGWHETAIDKIHNRQHFDCGDAALNEFLARFARQNHELGGARTFVAAADSDQTRVLGYYSLSIGSITHERAPPDIRKGLGRYDVPMFRLARLAVSRDAQGLGLGGALLFRAASRCRRAAADVGGVALLIDAKHERAASWYEKFGATRIEDEPLLLALSFKTLALAT